MLFKNILFSVLLKRIFLFFFVLNNKKLLSIFCLYMMRVKLMYIINIRESRNKIHINSYLGVIILYDHLKKKKKKKEKL